LLNKVKKNYYQMENNLDSLINSMVFFNMKTNKILMNFNSIKDQKNKIINDFKWGKKNLINIKIRIQEKETVNKILFLMLRMNKVYLMITFFKW
jgi:hypothetical protein